MESLAEPTGGTFSLINAEGENVEGVVVKKRKKGDKKK